MKQFRKFSEEHNRLLLDEEYLFAYSMFDGFSGRLLNAEFVVDYAYNYVLELKAFQHSKITTNKSDVLVETGKIEGRELKYMEDLLSGDFNTLKRIYDYEGLSIDDIGSQQFLINLDTITKDVHVSDGLSCECFKTDIELLLFDFNEYMKTLIESKYESWIRK